MGSDHPHSSLVGVSVHAPCPPGLCEDVGERTPGEISVARTLGARMCLEGVGWWSLVLSVPALWSLPQPGLKEALRIAGGSESLWSGKDAPGEYHLLCVSVTHWGLSPSATEPLCALPQESPALGSGPGGVSGAVAGLQPMYVTKALLAFGQGGVP